jgi:tetratricopeptide (TPR) repeat protein
MPNYMKSKTGSYFLAQLDFNGAITACTAVIDHKQATVDDYVCRAYAYCFVAEKNGANYDKAIADCSTALNMIIPNYTKQNGTVHRVRAFAYYLKGDYAFALADCRWVLDPPNTEWSDEEDKSFVREINEKIRLSTSTQECEKVLMTLEKLISMQSPPVPNIFPTLDKAETFHDMCEKMRNR